MELDYEAYLQTPEWQMKRLERLKMDDFRCARCGADKNVSVLHIHHTSYERWPYNEDVANDLITLCDRCHRRLHAYGESAKYDERIALFACSMFDKHARREVNMCKIEDIREAWGDRDGNAPVMKMQYLFAWVDAWFFHDAVIADRIEPKPHYVSELGFSDQKRAKLRNKLNVYASGAMLPKQKTIAEAAHGLVTSYTAYGRVTPDSLTGVSL